MILTTLPDLPPRPETAANAAFRRRFYARWGRENAIVCGRATLAEYAELPQTLSLKMVRGGRERYFVGRRELVVDDDNWLVLNDGARYASVLRAPRPASTFSVFFRPGLAAEVAAQRRRSLGAMLDAPECVATPPAFSEHLRGHGGAVTARLRHLEQAVHAGERDANWLEAQCMPCWMRCWSRTTGPRPPHRRRGPPSAPNCCAGCARRPTASKAISISR